MSFFDICVAFRFMHALLTDFLSLNLWQMYFAVEVGLDLSDTNACYTASFLCVANEIFHTLARRYLALNDVCVPLFLIIEGLNDYTWQSYAVYALFLPHVNLAVADTFYRFFCTRQQRQNCHTDFVCACTYLRLFINFSYQLHKMDNRKIPFFTFGFFVMYFRQSIYLSIISFKLNLEHTLLLITEQYEISNIFNHICGGSNWKYLVLEVCSNC